MANVTTTQTTKNNKPLIIAVASVLAVIVVLIVVLSCVKVDARVAINASEVSEIQIIKTGSYDYDTGKADGTIPLATEDEINDFLAAYEDASKHSAGYGILNGQWFAKVKKTGKEFSAENCKGIAASTDAPLIVISFGTEMQTAEVCGETVEYDLIVFNCKKTENALRTYSFWLIDTTVVYEQDSTSDEYVDYVAYEYKGVMNGSKLVNYVNGLSA